MPLGICRLFVMFAKKSSRFVYCVDFISHMALALLLGVFMSLEFVNFLAVTSSCLGIQAIC